MQYLYLMLLLEFVYSLYLFILRIPTTFGAVAFPVHAVIFNKYWQGELVFVVCVFEVEDILRGGGGGVGGGGGRGPGDRAGEGGGGGP